MRFSLSTFALTTPFVMALAQPPNSSCDDAALLCNQQDLAGNNTGAVGLPGFCAGTANLLWYIFTTNSLGGPANVTIGAINCPNIPGMADALTAVVLSGDGSCLPASFVAVSDCVSGTTDFSLVTQTLLPNTEYWLVVAGAVGGGNPVAAQCGFNIWLDGAGVDIPGVDFGTSGDVTIGQGESTQLEAYGGPPYEWSPTTGLSGSDIPDPIASPEGTTTYTVTTTINGCVFVGVITVEVIRRIDPPNTFTPNGDGINDVWEVPGIEDYPGAEVLIYDRWGQRIFRSVGYRDPWDGTNGGRALPSGTYYYHIQLNQLEGRSPPYMGFISIVR